MNESSAPLTFYFDYISPYAYLGFTQIHAVAERHGREVIALPVLFAALLNHNGHKGPAEIPSKREYVFRDVLRIGARLGERIEPPPSHPFNPLLALRVTLAAAQGDERRRVIAALYRATWGEGANGGPGIMDEAGIRAALAGAGVDADALLAGAVTPQVKTALRDSTTAALEAGVFGVPSVIADGELFWGVESFGHLERFLRGEDPVQAEDLERWRDLPASARRPGSQS